MKQIAEFHKRLHRWYHTHGRHDLPWRNTADPYHIYISEIMLQQTQVKTVLERYYHPFLQRFPTLAALAKARRAEVLKAWEGLGYYTRASNLHEAAIHAAPTLPNTVDDLLALPGIGRNTAHAIAAFAYHHPVPVMEANVKRTLCRIFAITHPDENTLWEKAHLLLDTSHPFDYNQAMMDIGAMVCTKRSPRCDICPASTLCKGRVEPELYPAPKHRKQAPVRHKNIVVFTRGNNYYAEARQEKFLHGLFGFMEYEAGGAAVSFQGRSYALDATLCIGSVTQSYSHFTLQAKVYKIQATGVIRGKWHSLKSLGRLPLSRADSKILRMLS